MKNLWDLAGVFAYLSLLTVGGGMAAFPEMKELTVDTYHWLTFPELLHFYSLGQLAPGPNMMMVASIGVVVGHIPGALVALIAFFLPTGLLTFFIGRLCSSAARTITQRSASSSVPTRTKPWSAIPSCARASNSSLPNIASFSPAKKNSRPNSNAATYSTGRSRRGRPT